MLAPGERVEVLVKADRDPGQYRLRNQPFNPAQGMMGGGMGRGMMGTLNIREIWGSVMAYTKSNSKSVVSTKAKLHFWTWTRFNSHKTLPPGLDSPVH